MKMMIATPCMSTIPTKFLSCMLDLRAICPTRYVNTENTLVYDARNDMAMNAIHHHYDRVMWIDSDMKFPPDLIERLSKHLDDGADLATALYFTRSIPTQPVIYSSLTEETRPDGVSYVKAERMTNFPRNAVFPIDACGFGAVMTTVDLLRRVYDRFGLPFFPLPSIGEDLAFCWRAKQIGARMVCDSSVSVGHIGFTEYNESLYDLLNASSGPAGQQKTTAHRTEHGDAKTNDHTPAQDTTPSEGT